MCRQHTRRLKSPRKLFAKSIHPTMATKGHGHGLELYIYILLTPSQSPHTHTQHTHSWYKAISNFEILKFNVKALAVKGHIVDPVSSRCISVSLSIGTTIIYIWPIRCFTSKKHIRNIETKIANKSISNRITPNFNQVISMTMGM